MPPCSRSTCVHHGDKAERGERGGERHSIWTGCDLGCCSRFLSLFHPVSVVGAGRCSTCPGKMRAPATCLDWERQTHSRRFAEDGGMEGWTEGQRGWIAGSRDFFQRLSLSHALCCHYPLIWISQMQHAAIPKGRNDGSLCFVTFIVKPFINVIIKYFSSDQSGYVYWYYCVFVIWGQCSEIITLQFVGFLNLGGDWSAQVFLMEFLIYHLFKMLPNNFSKPYLFMIKQVKSEHSVKILFLNFMF